ncbi:MAG: YqjF family protein [Pirellulales bacterium]
MKPERPFLTARWTELLVLNFAVPGDVIARLAPQGTEPDFFDGQAYLSVLGFMFRDARFYGLGLPWQRQFEEVNLRYYVRRETEWGTRRGVVFVREIAPQPLVATTARWLYNESYVTRRMRNSVRLTGSRLGGGDEICYEWRTGERGKRVWNRMAGRVAAPPLLPAPGSLAEFIIEHYWAYTHCRDGGTSEYRVAHRPWRVAPVEDLEWNCDLAATYGHTPLAEYLAAPPVLAFVADGSPVQVFRGRRLDQRTGDAKQAKSTEARELISPASCR